MVGIDVVSRLAAMLCNWGMDSLAWCPALPVSLLVVESRTLTIH